MESFYRHQPPLLIEGLVPGAVFSIEEKRYIWRGELGDGEVNVEDYATGNLHRVRDPQTGVKQVATVQWIQDALAKNILRIPLMPGDRPEKIKTPAGELDRDEMLAIDPHAEARQTLLIALSSEGADRNDPDLSSAIDRIWSTQLKQRFGERPRTSTVREWMTWTDPALPVLSQLLSSSGRVPRAKRLHPLSREIVEARGTWYYDGNAGRTIKDCEAAGSRDITALNTERRQNGLSEIPRPSREAYRREIRRTESRENWVRKYGEKAAKRYWQPSGLGRLATRALELVMMDDTVLDAVACIATADGRRFPAGRPYIIVAIDLYTRAILGWVLSFKPPSTHTAAECLRRVGREKMFIPPHWASRYPCLRMIGGKPAGVLTDNGKNYVSSAFQEGCAEAGITLNLAPIRSPKAKAVIERFFFTLKTWLLQKLPGATLSPAVMRELGYDPEAKAVLLVEELEELIHEFVHTYHVNVHSGINEQPAAAWLRSIEAHPRAILDERALDVMTLITIHGRRLTANGVRWKHLTYRIGDLERLQAANLPREKMKSRLSATTACTVKIKVDPDDVGHIWVFDPSTHTYVELLSTQQEYASGLTLDQHLQAREWAKRRNLEFNTEEERLAAVAALNDYIEAIIPHLKTRQRRGLAKHLQGPLSDQRTVPVLHAHARHDGMGEVVEHDAAAGEKEDWDSVPTRPHSGAVAEGGGHDADPREDDQGDGEGAFDPITGLFLPPEDDDEMHEGDYA